MTMQLLEQYMLEVDRAFGEEDYAKGKGILEEVLALEPDHGEAHNYLGWLYMYQLNDQEKAEQHLIWAMRYKPSCRGAHVHLASLLADQRRYDELREFLPRAFQVRGINQVSLYVDQARMYEQLGQYRVAVRCYKAAMRVSLSDAEMDGLRDHIRRCRRKRWIRWI